MDFAKRLKELRASRGLTQDDLARELNLVKSSISMYENGKRVNQALRFSKQSQTIST